MTNVIGDMHKKLGAEFRAYCVNGAYALIAGNWAVMLSKPAAPSKHLFIASCILALLFLFLHGCRLYRNLTFGKERIEDSSKYDQKSEKEWIYKDDKFAVFIIILLGAGFMVFFAGIVAVLTS